MGIFDFQRKITYSTSYHAEKRAVERVPGCTWGMARSVVLELANTGELLIEVDKYRYIKNGNYFLPCIQDRKTENGYDYVVKSVLTWDMVKDRLQEVIDRYHLYNYFD